MRRALISACALLGLMLGYCSQPREIRAAEAPLRFDKQVKADVRAGFQGERAAAWIDNPAYPVEQRTCVGCHPGGK